MEDLKKRWDDMNETDKYVIGMGGACIVGGLLLAIAMREPLMFPAGAVIGAAVIGARIYLKQEKKPPVVVQELPKIKRDAASYKDDDMPGAPIMSPVDRGTITTFAGPTTRSEAVKYPLMHRIREAQAWTDELDDRIRWPTTGPTGPYVGDRGIFGFQ